MSNLLIKDNQLISMIAISLLCISIIIIYSEIYKIKINILYVLV